MIKFIYNSIVMQLFGLREMSDEKKDMYIVGLIIMFEVILPRKNQRASVNKM